MTTVSELNLFNEFLDKTYINKLPDYCQLIVTEFCGFVIKNGKIVHRDGQLLQVYPIDVFDYRYDVLIKSAPLVYYDDSSKLTAEVYLGIGINKLYRIIFINTNKDVVEVQIHLEKHEENINGALSLIAGYHYIRTDTETYIKGHEDDENDEDDASNLSEEYEYDDDYDF
jgi:hypothetical protein